ncbi:MAG: phosphate starvation-inducible protein PhoH [Flavobacteriales bacterium CG03_land_8_20_14_0_80_35_15]|nr:PhoH family protein [Zetaproteobacteria bacterium]NDK18171.1 PhoH family protein [Flavobacteriales bacterium]OIO09473.1 MAG: phosphate starvation-inducible protein PhoH [Flavobacteriaceae bacterium CG1_02_35_72]PIR12469.1 MAG: phosphate starvation-inducible protein PhoH [Flavobacteriales bacterium CG11_big_fil_rev_8_21_14_0_20_35_7]PIV17020.1 MAG: phosphate starvation-inducible protein PhoH [Flavobacteriales bacterium CG03_land_8_20_14_0_80_35_15]PIX06911.1 MAG: phosphate starvation-inducib
MNERVLILENINVFEFLGTHNQNIIHIKSLFPKLKIVSRGNEIKAYGDLDVLDVFEKRFDALINYFNTYNKLDENIIERIVLDETINKDLTNEVLVHGVSGKLIKAQTQNQRLLVTASENHDMVFAVGPAGTGKTYTAVALAVRALKNKEVKRIILTRPAVEAGENLGFLPGDLKDKLDPYMQPLYDALRDMIPFERLTEYVERGIIQIAPLAFMRGRTLDHAFVILDEAQNATHPQMKMFLTRMGKSAKFIITGDPSQIDLPPRQDSGLIEALLALKMVKGIAIIHLDEKDVIRHHLVRKIIEAYKEITPK